MSGTLHRGARFYALALWVTAALSLAGCSGGGDVLFRLSRENKEPDAVTLEQKQQVVDGLVAVFGDPDEPYDLNQFAESGLNFNKLNMAAGPAARTLEGGQRGLYREHCAHCHGVTGDGAGPTAVFLNPYPRDYRKATFKFTSTGQGMPPTMEDLRRILRQGIPGTAMPSFATLPADQIDALAQYVKYLSLRGQVEESLFDLVVNQEEKLTRENIISEALQPAVERWNEAETSVIDPPARLMELADTDRNGKLSREEAKTRLEAAFSMVDTDGDRVITANERQAALVVDPALYVGADGDGDGGVSLDEAFAWLASDFEKGDANHDDVVDTIEYERGLVAAGKVLFQDAKRAQCVKCHGPTGLGDGGEILFDDWNKDKKDLTPSDIARRFNLPKQVLRPRNLRLGIYRGGMRPLDLYRRMHAGIKGTSMPAAGPSAGNAGTLKPEEIWSLVEYVRSLPYEEMSRSKPKPSRVARDVN